MQFFEGMIRPGLARSPDARTVEVSKRIVKPYRTVRRELEALHTLGLLCCDEDPLDSSRFA